MSRTDVANARARTELDIVARLDGVGADLTAGFVLFVRLAALHTRLHNARNHQERQAAEAERQPDMTGILAPGAVEKRYGTTPTLH